MSVHRSTAGLLAAGLLGLLSIPAHAQSGVVWRAAVPELLTIDVSADGSRVLVGSGGSDSFVRERLQLRSAADGALLLDLDGGTTQNNFSTPVAVALNEAGTQFISTHSYYDGSEGGGNGLHDWHLWSDSGDLLRYTRAGTFLLDVDVLGGRVAFANYGLNDVRVRDVATGDILRTFLVGGDIETLAFSPDSTLLVTGAESTLDDGIVRVHPLDGRPARSATFSDGVPYDVAFSPDGAFVVVGTYSYYSEGARLVVVRVADAAVVLNVHVPYAGEIKADFTADGEFLVARSSGFRELLEVRRVSDGAVVLSEDLGPPPGAFFGSPLDVRRVPGTNRVAYARSDTLIVRAFDMDGSVVSTEAAPGAVALSVSPNPATGPAMVHIRLPESQPVRVDVFDALGRRVARLHDGPLAAGDHALRVDVERLPPGVYSVRATGTAWAEVRRLTVVR